MEPSNDSSQDQLFSADRPILNRSDDKLGRRHFAEAVASAIEGWRGRDSLVIALYGPWGTGKSSLKNMAIEALRERKDRDVVVAEFNPWQFANRDQLTEAFFDQIGVALGRGELASRKDRKALLNQWRRYAAYLKAGNNLIDTVRKPIIWVFGVAGVLLAGSAALNVQRVSFWFGLALVGGAALLSVSARAAQTLADFFEVGVNVGRRSLEEVKAELAERLRKLQAPVVVVVDDVDRLTPQEVQELFQLIKANADFPNLVYLVLFERVVVEKNIERMLEVSGRDYLEKIVQVGFDIPVIEQPRLHRILFEGLDKAVNDPVVAKHFDKRRWGNLFFGGLQAYFGTLRNVNRFLSTVAFHVSLFRGAGSFEVNPIDLICLEVLRMFEPEVYRALPSNKELLTRLRDRHGREDDARHTIEAIIDNAPETRRERVREVIKQLFPAAEWALGGSHYAHGFEDEWTRTLRIASADIFDRYFNFVIPEGDVAQATIDRILGVVGDREELRREFRSLKDKGLLAVVLERLEVYKQTLPLEHAEAFVTAVFDVGDDLPGEGSGMFEISPAMHATRIVYWYLRQEPDLERRRSILREAIRSTEGISLPVDFVALEEQAAAPERQGRERLLSDEGLGELRQLCLEKIEAAAQSQKLQNASQFLSILYRWKHWAGIHRPREVCIRLGETREGVILLLKTFLLRSTSHGLGDYVGREHWYIKLGDLEEFVPREQVEDRLDGFEPESLPEQEKRALSAFRKAVDRRRRGRPDYEGFRSVDEDEE